MRSHTKLSSHTKHSARAPPSSLGNAETSGGGAAFEVPMVYTHQGYKNVTEPTTAGAQRGDEAGTPRYQLNISHFLPLFNKIRFSFFGAVVSVHVCVFFLSLSLFRLMLYHKIRGCPQ